LRSQHEGRAVRRGKRNPAFRPFGRYIAALYRSWAKAVMFEWPFTANLLEQLARTYDHEATYFDIDANIRKRLNY
jgi:hypothetical protein